MYLRKVSLKRNGDELGKTSKRVMGLVLGRGSERRCSWDWALEVGVEELGMTQLANKFSWGCIFHFSFDPRCVDICYTTHPKNYPGYGIQSMMESYREE